MTANIDSQLPSDLAEFALEAGRLPPLEVCRRLALLLDEETGHRLAAEIFWSTAPIGILESGRRPDPNEFYLQLVGRLGLLQQLKKSEDRAEELSTQFWLDA